MKEENLLLNQRDHVLIRESPKELNRSSNLTGSERKIKDGAADVHNIILKWKKLHTQGLEIANTIANIKLQYLYKLEEENEQKESLKIPEELEAPCNELQDVVQKMEKILRKLEMTSQMFSGVMKLEHHTSDNTILFQTWTADMFVLTINEIVQMYRKEYKLKDLIYQNICHAKDRNTMMFYTSSWLHQPYITEKCELLLESLLIETGHKKS